MLVFSAESRRFRALDSRMKMHSTAVRNEKTNTVQDFTSLESRKARGVVHLPEVGIRGNSHFPFAEKNNLEVAGALEAWLKEKGLDARK